MAFPQGVVRVVGEDGAPTRGLEGQSIAIADLGAFFRVLGPDDARLKWQERYGFGTLGTDGSGKHVYDAFPMLSQIGWMNIDEVVIEGSNLISIAEESERAAVIAGGPVERDLFTQIARLACQASQRNLKLEFGHA
jgi:hypothetical protein